MAEQGPEAIWIPLNAFQNSKGFQAITEPLKNKKKQQKSFSFLEIWFRKNTFENTSY